MAATAAAILGDLIAAYLPSLLLLYWLLAAGSVIVTLLPVPVPQALKDAVVLSACRGKLWQDKPAALGPLKDWSVPQRWFLHFYLWGAACNAAALAAYSLSTGGSSNTAVQTQTLLLLGLFQLHLVRRALETGLLLRYPPEARMHGIAYLFGMSYYTVASLSLLPATWIAQQQWQQQQHVQAATSSLAATARQLQQQLAAVPAQLNRVQLLGASIFLAGNVLQFAAHNGLAGMSRPEQVAYRGQRMGYVIPSGGLFELVSCPHYLAEIIIYAGLLIASQGQLLPALMLVWVAVNLVLAAAATHKWYRRQFRAYPPGRKALIPFIF